MEARQTAGWLEEIQEQDLSDVHGGQQAISCSTNTFSLSDYYGNTGWFCTITRECMAIC